MTRKDRQTLPTVLVIAAGGGHLTEAMLAIKDVPMRRVIATFRFGHTDQMLAKEEHFYLIDPHKSLIKFVVNGIQSLYIILRVRPRAIVNTGGGISIACSLLGKLVGTKLIFVESGARVTTPSRTGRFLYRYTDLFIVQWKPLLEHYPKAVFGGPLL